MMGVEPAISYDRFPKQGKYLGHRTRVCFYYQAPDIMGTVIRDDAEAPWKTIIRLDDGRVVLATECMYSPELEPPVAGASAGAVAPLDLIHVLEVAQRWLANSVPVVDLQGPRPLPLIAELLVRLRRADGR